MKNFIIDEVELEEVRHPILEKTIFVPKGFRYYKQAKEGKLPSTQMCLQEFGQVDDGTIVLEPYAGVGILTLVYIEAGYTPFLIEQEEQLVTALQRNIAEHAPDASLVECFHADNMTILPSIASDDPNVGVIDLDSYTYATSQIQEAARILKQGLLFVSSGEVLPMCRFKQFDFVKKRYGIDFQGPWRNFSEEVLYRFIEETFQEYGKSTELLHTFTWPTVCRLCIRVN